VTRFFIFWDRSGNGCPHVMSIMARMGREKMSQSKLGGKMEWTDPALVVLTRNRPEETVLAACKSRETFVGTSSMSQNYGCHDNFECWADCYNVFTTS